MDIDKQTQQKIQTLQVLEQNLRNILLQKQAFQLELDETNNALEEVKKTKKDIFRIVGQVMLKTEKKDMQKELKEKKDLLDLRMKSIIKQENQLTETLERLKAEIVDKIK